MQPTDRTTDRLTDRLFEIIQNSHFHIHIPFKKKQNVAGWLDVYCYFHVDEWGWGEERAS